MCEISATEERLKVVQFSDYVLFDQTTFISQSPGIATNDYILDSFGNLLWLLNLASFALAFASICLVRLIYDRTIKDTQTVQLEVVFIQMYGLYLKQCELNELVFGPLSALHSECLISIFSCMFSFKPTL